MNPKTYAALLVIAIAAAGCLGIRPVPCDDPAKPFCGQTLTILDQGSFPQLKEVKATFENRTGARVIQLDGGDAGSALRLALLAAGNPPADLLFGVDNALFAFPTIRSSNLFLPYESPNLPRIDANLIDLDAFRIDGQLWATPLEHGYISVNYDIRLEQQPGANTTPQTLRALATPTWAPKFVTSDPRFSSPGLGFLLLTIANFPDDSSYTWKTYWRDLLRNGARVAQDWTEAYVYHYSGGYGQFDEANRGDRSLVVSYTTSPAVEVLFGTPSVPGRSLEPDQGVFHQVETIGILRGTKSIDLAKAFIDFTLEDEFQRHNAPLNAVYPVVRGITLPDEFHTLATDPADLRPAQIPPNVLAANLSDWLTQWTTIYQETRA